jgi:hypothetical protein
MSAQETYEKALAEAKARRAAKKEKGELAKKAEEGFDASGEMVVKGPRGGTIGAVVGESARPPQRRADRRGSGDTRVSR